MIVDELILRLRGEADGSVKKLDSILDGLATVAAAATAALVGVTYAASRTADEAIKSARSVGLTVEALTELRFAAGLAGVSSEQLRVGLVALSRNAQAAAHGGGEAVKAFAQLGVRLRGTDGELRGTDQIFEDVIGRLAGVTSETERLGLAQRIFGEQGSRFASLIAGGAEGMRAARIEARRLGLVYSTEASVGAERLNDSTDMLIGRVKGLAINFGLRLVPTAQRVVDGLTAIVEAGTPLALDLIDRAARGLDHTLRMLETPVGRVVGVLASAVVARGLYNVAGGIFEVARSVPVLGAAMDRAAGPVRAFLAVAAPVAIAMAAIYLALDDLDAAAEGADSAFARLAKSMGVESEFRAAVRGAKEALQGLADVVGTSLERAFEAASAALSRLLARLSIQLPDVGLGRALSAIGGTASSAGSVLRAAAAGVQRGAYSRSVEIVPASGGPSAAAQQLVEMGGVTINVSGAGDPAAVAAAVERALQRAYPQATP